MRSSQRFSIWTVLILTLADIALCSQLAKRGIHRPKHLPTRGTHEAAGAAQRPAPCFLTAKSKPFAVNGSALPDTDFDVGESYAGVLPISDHPDESRKLYFWFFPSTNPKASKEITVWLQGGPGGASTGGLLLENGPLIFQPGTAKPARNTFSWNNLTNMVWIDQPVGTGFSLTDQFMGFWKNFVDTFDMHGYKVYLTGESYAGFYVPYIANGFIDAKDSKYFNFKGAAINDPVMGNDILHFETAAVQYLNTWSKAFSLNSTAMAHYNAMDEKCGYPAYLEKYLTFPPPPGPFPGVFGEGNFSTNMPQECELQVPIIYAALELNPCFNYDHIFDTCPALYSPLGPGIFLNNAEPPGPVVYYDRPDVRKAIHAPAGVNWSLGSSDPVFVGPSKPWLTGRGDDSLPPAQIGIVSKIVEHTNNIIIGVGGLDFQLPVNGTLLVIQNMTWNGVQGFSKYPDKTLFVPKYNTSVTNNPLSGHGEMGTWVSERGLTFYISDLAGHEQPWYTPGVSYRVIETMLGRIPNLSAK